MKNSLKLIALLLVMFAFSSVLRAQSNTNKTKVTAPSDQLSGFTYDFNKAINLIIARIETPSKSNADVQVFLDQKDFPAPPVSKKVDATYKDQLRIWMEKNPDLIINTLKPRTDIVTQY